MLQYVTQSSCVQEFRVMAAYEAHCVWAIWKNQWIVSATNSASFFLQEIIGMTWSSFVSLCLQGGGTPAV